MFPIYGLRKEENMVHLTKHEHFGFNGRFAVFITTKFGSMESRGRYKKI